MIKLKDEYNELVIPENSQPHLSFDDVIKQFEKWKIKSIDDELTIHLPFVSTAPVKWTMQPKTEPLTPSTWGGKKVKAEELRRDFTALEKDPDAAISQFTLSLAVNKLRNAKQVAPDQWQTYGPLLFRTVGARAAEARMRRPLAFDVGAMLRARDDLLSIDVNKGKPENELESKKEYLEQNSYITSFELATTIEVIRGSYAALNAERRPIRFTGGWPWPSPMTDWFAVWRSAIKPDRWVPFAARVAGVGSGPMRVENSAFASFSRRMAGVRWFSRVENGRFASLAMRMAGVRAPGRMDATDFRSFSARMASQGNKIF